MNKRPELIISVIINYLSTKKKDSLCSTEEIAENTGLNPETVGKYLKLIYAIQDFAPKLGPVTSGSGVEEKESFTVRICDYAPRIKRLPPSEKLLLTLFVEKAFDPESGMVIGCRKENLPEKYVRVTENKLFLTTSGKIGAQRVLNRFYGEICDLFDGR